MGILGGISGDTVIKKLERIGYHAVRQRGSHVQMRHSNSSKYRLIPVPRHKELGIGLLKKIIKSADLTVEEFIKL